MKFNGKIRHNIIKNEIELLDQRTQRGAFG